MEKETLEEAAERYDSDRDSFIAGAKYMAERMYSEEEVFNIAQQLRLQLKSGVLKWQDDFEFDLTEWFEQFKKK